MVTVFIYAVSVSLATQRAAHVNVVSIERWQYCVFEPPFGDFMGKISGFLKPLLEIMKHFQYLCGTTTGITSKSAHSEGV